MTVILVGVALKFTGGSDSAGVHVCLGARGVGMAGEEVAGETERGGRYK